MTDPTYEKGMHLLKQLHGGHAGEQMVTELGDLSPELLDMTVRWAFGEVMSRPGLDLKTRELTIISACIARPGLEPQLQAHYEAALNLGATQQEIIEVILQMVFYAGLAAASNALRLLAKVIS